MAYFPVRRIARALSQSFPILPALLLVGVALLAGCHPAAVTDPKDPKFIVAEKGNWQITRAELDAEVAGFLKQRQATPEMVGPAKMPIVETAMLKNMVLKKLLLERAATLPLQDVDKEEAAELEKLKGPASDDDFAKQLSTAGLTLDDLKKKIHEKVLISKVLDAEAFKDVDPTDQEINDFYLQNKASITTPPQVRASRILVHLDDKISPTDKAAKKKIIDKAHDRVMHGEEFSKVAMQMSEDQSSKTKGGDLDYFRPNENEPGFDDVAFNTKLGVVSPVFETSLGYQFIKVTDIKPAGEVPLADVRDKIAGYLKERKMSDESQEYAKKLLANSGVTYHITLVDPPAQVAPEAESGGGAPGNAPAASAPDAATAPAAATPDASSAPTPAPDGTTPPK